MRYKEFIVEYNKQITVQNFGDKIIDQFRKEGPEAWVSVGLDKSKSSIPEYRDLYKTALIGAFEKLDPTPHKEYTQWLCKTYAAGLGVVTKYEDFASRGSSALERFQKLKIKKQLKPEHKDINRFKSMQDFEQTVATYPEPQEVIVDKGKAELVYSDDSLRVITPMDEQAAKYYGQGTTWCTAAKNNNAFTRYHQKGYLYIILPTKPATPGEKYQFHFEEGQFMNASDSPLTSEGWDSLLLRYPQLVQIFSKQADSNMCIPLLPNRQLIIEYWDMMQGSVAGSVAERLPFPRISMILQREFPSGAGTVANPNLSATLVNQFVRDLKADKYGVMEIFMDALTPENFSDGELYFDVMNDVLSSWVTENSVGDQIIDLEEDRKIDAMGAYIELTSVIFNLAMPMVKQEMHKFFESELADLVDELS